MRSFAMARTLSFIEVFTLLVRGFALMYALRFAVAWCFQLTTQILLF
jgi:hypothetical protein